MFGRKNYEKDKVETKSFFYQEIRHYLRFCIENINCYPVNIIVIKQIFEIKKKFKPLKSI